MDQIQRAFVEFDRQHPEVYKLFTEFAWELRSAGRLRYSARTIIHRIRWHYAVNPERDGGFKINNNYSSRYARKLIRDDSSFDGFFELRTCGGDELDDPIPVATEHGPFIF